MTQEMPFYICHKRVRALEIASVEGDREVHHQAIERKITFRDQSGALQPIWLPLNMFIRYIPKPGDFYVVYEDGYQSFSPRKAFLEGYDLAPPNDNIMMEMLNDLADTGPGTTPEETPEWLKGMDWVHHVRRVAREAYVTINSLKQQVERLNERIERFKRVMDPKPEEELFDEKADPGKA